MGQQHLQKYDGRIEDVPCECILEEHRAMVKEVGSKVKARFGQKVWTGVVMKRLEWPSALDLALPEKRSCSKKTVCSELTVV